MEEGKTFASALSSILSNERSAKPRKATSVSKNSDGKKESPILKERVSSVNDRLSVFHENFRTSKVYTEDEEYLIRIATKGVVQIFNSLNKYKKAETESEISVEKERKRPKVEKPIEKVPRWNVLRDSFLKSMPTDNNHM